MPTSRGRIRFIWRTRWRRSSTRSVTPRRGRSRGVDDGRDSPTGRRSERIIELLIDLRVTGTLIASPLVSAPTWADVRSAYNRAREMSAEGLMLKRLDGPYGVGRRRGGWWKW